MQSERDTFIEYKLDKIHTLYALKIQFLLSSTSSDESRVSIYVFILIKTFRNERTRKCYIVFESKMIVVTEWLSEVNIVSRSFLFVDRNVIAKCYIENGMKMVFLIKLFCFRKRKQTFWDRRCKTDDEFWWLQYKRTKYTAILLEHVTWKFEYSDRLLFMDKKIYK